MSVLMKYKYWIGGVFCLVVIALVIVAIRPKGVSGAASAGPLEVQVVQVERKDVPIYGEWIGTLDGLVNADVRAQVTGYLERQAYQEGAFVKKGQLLFQIDPRPFQAALEVPSNSNLTDLEIYEAGYLPQDHALVLLH